MSVRRLFLAVFGCALLMIGGCKAKPAADTGQALPTVPVRVLTVAAEASQAGNEVAATVEAVRQATIAAKVAGTIEEIPVRLGSVVQKGALLVKIRAGEITARLSQAETQWQQAKRHLEREQRLLEKEATTRESVKSMEEACRVAEAGYREAQAMLGYTIIRAPFDGLVSRKSAQAGDMALPGMPLLVLEDAQALQVVANVPEALVAGVKSGDTLPVQIPAASLTTSGVVTEIAPAADALSRTSLVKLTIKAASLVRPGQFARVTLPTEATPGLWIPESAVVRFGQMERLFVVQNAMAHLRLVRTGERRGGQVEILAGLHAGEQVVTEGAAQLADGQPLTVQP